LIYLKSLIISAVARNGPALGRLVSQGRGLTTTAIDDFGLYTVLAPGQGRRLMLA